MSQLAVIILFKSFRVCVTGRGDGVSRNLTLKLWVSKSLTFNIEHIGYADCPTH